MTPSLWVAITWDLCTHISLVEPLECACGEDSVKHWWGNEEFGDNFIHSLRWGPFLSECSRLIHHHHCPSSFQSFPPREGLDPLCYGVAGWCVAHLYSGSLFSVFHGGSTWVDADEWIKESRKGPSILFLLPAHMPSPSSLRQIITTSS